MPSRKKQRPLLYIDQPFARTPSNQMQEVYRNKIEKRPLKEEPEQEEAIQELLPLNEEAENIQSEIELNTELNTELNIEPQPALTQHAKSIETTSSEKKSTFLSGNDPYRSSFNKVKSFKEMNIEERLEYLLNFPKALPPVPCVFYTKNSNYQGYLQDYQNEMITIKFHDQTTADIPFDLLENVLMIGIRK